MHQVLRPLAAQHHRTDNPTVEAKEKAVAVEEITIPKTREIRLQHRPSRGNFMTQETTLAGIMPTMYKGRTANRLMKGAEVVSTNRHDSHSATLEGRTLVDEGASDKVPGARKRPEKSRTRKENHILNRCSHFSICCQKKKESMLKSVLGRAVPLYLFWHF